MRFAIIIYGSLVTVSGGYLYDRMLVEALERAGDTVEVFSIPWRDTWRHIGDNFSPRLLEKLARLKADVLLQDELNHPSLFWMNDRLRKRKGPLSGYPIVSIVHHLRSSERRPVWQNSIARQVELRYLRSLDGFIFNSQTTRGEVLSLAGDSLEGKAGIVAYPAGDRLKPCIDNDEISRRAYQAGPLRLIFVGNIIPRKGLHLLLEALVQVPRDLWRLQAVGSHMVDRAYARSLRRQTEAYGFQGQVAFTGPRSDDELAEDLRSSHILVIPSFYEGFGIAYLEGMGYGLPAIASACGGAGEIITPGQDGYLVDPRDAAGLAGLVQELALDRGRLLAMSRAARRRFLAHPTWEESMGRAVEFLHGMGG
jgi:glycosyltransferase involved in cell wall biosynthesis